jgi:hypothetical protein
VPHALKAGMPQCTIDKLRDVTVDGAAFSGTGTRYRAP